jgi:glycosyltransferase involved in cell wall biosynthesis
LLALARAFRVPTVFHLHSGAFDAFALNGGRLKQALVRATLRRSDVVIVLSERWSGWVKQFAPGSVVRVIPNPVDVPATLAKRTMEEGAGRVLYLGLITEAKGAFDLLRAWAIFRADVPGWRLCVGGYGEIDRFLSEAERLGIRGDLDFLGWVAGPDKARALESADVFALPSYKEGMPVSILEAMAFGAAVVATSVGGVPDMLRADTDGLLVSPGDIQGLARALVRLAGSAELRSNLVREARVRVGRRYSTETVIGQLSAVYDEVVAQRHASSPRMEA